jgi:hypothetical protein
MKPPKRRLAGTAICVTASYRRVSCEVRHKGERVFYEEGLSDGWNPIRAYWQEPSQANREALRSFLAPDTTR